MSDLSQQLAALRAQLDALSKIKTQEDFDEGARLHNAKNAPWVKGPYSDLIFPPYRYQQFPQMVYSASYLDAVQAYEEALMVPARGSEDNARSLAILKAERKKLEAVKTVHDGDELARALATGWYEGPEGAAKAKQAAQDAIALAAAERAYDDRNMGEKAKAEIDAFDEQSDDFVAVIPERKKPGPRAKVTV